MSEAAPIEFMEEHLQAYFAWKRAGVKDAWCWHVDAHLDIGKLGLSEERLSKLQSCSSAEEAKEAKLLGNSYLPWGGLHCGNYLYPAIKEGLVGRLTWVIPPDLPEGTMLRWSREHINNWFDLSLGEFESLQLKDDKVEGTLLGIPFEMGTLESLGVPEEPVLLDVDLDYFLNDDGSAWQSSEEFLERINGLKSVFTTVAFSVVGGFTPTQERQLGSAFGRQLSAGDYQATELDRLAFLVRNHEYEQALDLCEALEMTTEALFLKGSALQALSKKEEALEVWRALLSRADIPTDGLAYLHGLCSELELGLERPKEALEHSLLAQKHSSNDYRHRWTEAVAREALDEPRKAVKALRRTIRLSEELLFGLKARLALSRLYREQKKTGLAKMEMQKLAQLDVTGEFRPFTILQS